MIHPVYISLILYNNYYDLNADRERIAVARVRKTLEREWEVTDFCRACE